MSSTTPLRHLYDPHVPSTPPLGPSMFSAAASPHSWWAWLGCWAWLGSWACWPGLRQLLYTRDLWLPPHSWWAWLGCWPCWPQGPLAPSPILVGLAGLLGLLTPGTSGSLPTPGGPCWVAGPADAASADSSMTGASGSLLTPGPTRLPLISWRQSRIFHRPWQHQSAPAHVI